MKWKEKLRGPLFNQDKSEIKGLKSFYQEGGEILGETKPAAARQRENVSLLAACFNWVRGSYHLYTHTHESFKYLVPGSMPEKKTKGSFQEILSY